MENAYSGPEVSNQSSFALNGVSYEYKLSLFELKGHLKACVSISILCMDNLFIDESGVLKSSTLIVLIVLLISPFTVLVYALHIVVFLYWVYIYL